MVVSIFKNTLNENISKYRASIVKVLSKYRVVEMLEKIMYRKNFLQKIGQSPKRNFEWKICRVLVCLEKNLLILNLDNFCETENKTVASKEEKKE